MSKFNVLKTQIVDELKQYHHQRDKEKKPPVGSCNKNDGGGGDAKPNLFAHMRSVQIVRPSPSFMALDKLFLDGIAAYNVHLDVGDNKTSSIVTLREVPL